MEAMEPERVTIGSFLEGAIFDFEKKFDYEADDSGWRKCVAFIGRFFFLLTFGSLFSVLATILFSIRLAVTHADRVVFVLVSVLLSFYQVPRKVFYIYMAVLASTGFLQFIRYNYTAKINFLHKLSSMSCGTSDKFLRKFTTLHFSNPFTRCLTESKVVYVPIGLEITSFARIEVFDFLVSDHLNFDRTVGVCRIKIDTLGDTGISTIRVLFVDAPWGRSFYTVDMENDNLRRLITYFNRVAESNCSELICTVLDNHLEALSILGAVKHFNSGVQLVKLELRSRDCIFII